MIVVKTDQDPPTFPYDAKKDAVIEAKVKSLGEVSELQPGKSGKLTVNLRPGSYVLYCNQAGHMHQGMWTSSLGGKGGVNSLDLGLFADGRHDFSCCIRQAEDGDEVGAFKVKTHCGLDVSLGGIELRDNDF